MPCQLKRIQEYLPFNLAEHSSFAPDGDKHILRTPEAELRDKKWDDDKLAEWEAKVQGGKAWPGRAQAAAKQQSRSSL